VQIEFNSGLFNSATVNATRLVLRDNFGQPILLAYEHDPQTIVVHKAKPGDNEELKRALAQFGIQMTNQVKEIEI
jgi:hypothetical protein